MFVKCFILYFDSLSAVSVSGSFGQKWVSNESRIIKHVTVFIIRHRMAELNETLTVRQSGGDERRRSVTLKRKLNRFYLWVGTANQNISITFKLSQIAHDSLMFQRMRNRFSACSMINNRQTLNLRWTWEPPQRGTNDNLRIVDYLSVVSGKILA